MVDDAKRDELRAKIEAGEQRNAERTIADQARDAADTAGAFVKEHPLATLAGVAVIGLAIGAMTKPGRRAGRVAGERAGAFASYAGELGTAYATGLFDASRRAVEAGGDTLEDIGDSVSRTSRGARRQATQSLGDTGDSLRFLGRRAARKAGRTARNARHKVGV